MAQGATFTFEGIPGFRDALERAADDIRAKVSGTMERTAHNVRDTARSYLDDGDLSSQIIVTGRRLNWTVGISDAVIPSRGGDRVHQRPFIYGAIRERGTRHQGARPFMRPAADIHLPRFQSELPNIGLVI